MDEIIDLNESKKMLDVINSNYSSLEKEIKLKKGLKEKKEKELSILSCESKVSLHKFVLNGKKKFEVNKTTSRKKLELVDKFGPLV